MRMIHLTALASTAALCGVAFAMSALAQAPAQAPAQPNCGPVAYSQADQKYVGVPCNAPTHQTSDGKPCGPVAYSVAEQKYVGVPCQTKQ